MKFEYFWAECRKIWKLCGSPPGTKPEAQIEFDKHKFTDAEIEDILFAALQQAVAKKEAKKAGGSPPNFKNVCRYLKYKGWESDVDQIDKPNYKKSRCEQELERIADRRTELTAPR